MNTDVTDLSAPQNSPVWADRKKGLEPQLHVTFGKYILYKEKGKVRGKLGPVIVNAAKKPGVLSPSPPTLHREQSGAGLREEGSGAG